MQATDGLQPIPRDSNYKGLAAMLDNTSKRSQWEIFGELLSNMAVMTSNEDQEYTKKWVDLT